jgi:hypothetical protein
MKQRRVLLVGLVAGVVLGVIGVALWSLGLLTPRTLYREVPAGDQEIVLLMPATSGDTWERFVAATDALAEEARATGKPLTINKNRAFVEQTADVPEVVLGVPGVSGKLWVRWYKLGGPNTAEKWLEELCDRPTPPLAIIGGEISGRAKVLAEALQKKRQHWKPAAPVLLISTATADQYVPRESTTEDAKANAPQLIGLYEGRSFRFSFTNSRMAEVILAFVRTRDELWPWPRSLPLGMPLAGMAVQPDPMSRWLTTVASEPLAYTLHALQWEDDRYSVDLADRFADLFANTFHAPVGYTNHIPCSAGDFYYANIEELRLIDELVVEIKRLRTVRQLLVLPTGAERARRFLRTLLRTTGRPDVRHLVVISGDSINFNTIYRDHEVTWNVRDLEVPLVLFSHRNPIDPSVGFVDLEHGKSLRDSTGTEELLLYRDILEAVLLCAYRDDRLVQSADELLANLRLLDWSEGRVRAWWGLKNGHPSRRSPLFDAAGNRCKDTGEHVIVLQPEPQNEQGIVASGFVTVWRLQGDPSHHDSWNEVAPPLPLRIRND